MRSQDIYTSNILKREAIKQQIIKDKNEVSMRGYWSRDIETEKCWAHDEEKVCTFKAKD